MRDSVPWFTQPAWVDPDRTPLRNAYHRRARETRQAAQQLRINLPIQFRPDTS